MLTNLVIQDLVLVAAVLLESAKEPDDIRILIKSSNETKLANGLRLRTFCKKVRRRTRLMTKFRH